MTTKSLSLNSLILDLENPRIIQAGSQRDAMQRIIEDQGTNLAVLAENIVNQNGLNPMDRWLVLKQDNSSKYIVYEGNRRLTALKILNNPSVLGSLEVNPALRKRLERAAAKFNLREFGKIDCYIIADRPEGAMWLHQRHTGENKGSGIVRWGGVATARFRGNDPGLQALDWVLKFGGLDAEEKDALENNFPITTLNRLLASKEVRALIGFDVKQSKLFTDLPSSEAFRVMTRIIRDLSYGEIKVTALKDTKAQLVYVNGLGSDLPNLSLRTVTLQAIEEWGEVSPSSNGAGAAQSKDGNGNGSNDGSKKGKSAKAQAAGADKKRSNERIVLITKDCVLNINNAKIREIEGELRTLKLSEHRHAIAVLFRVFLETSIDVFLTAKGIPLKASHNSREIDKNLKTKVNDAITALIAEGVPSKHLDGVSKGINDRTNPIYIDTLHAYVHNQFYSPRESDLSVAFDNARAFFEAIWK